MKISQVCARYYPDVGGQETCIKEISERLARDGFHVEVLTTDPSGKLQTEEVFNDVRIVRFPSWAPNEAYYLSSKLKKYLVKNQNRYDIVHAHSYHAFPAVYAAQAKRENKLIIHPHYHGGGHSFFRSLLHIPYKFLGKKIFEKADKIVCVSNFERSLVMKNFEVKNEKVVVIPNGVNIQESKGSKQRRKNHRVILYVGRLEKYKGIHHLIESLPVLTNNTFLEIVGKGHYKKSLVRLARKLGVENRTRFFQDLPTRELRQKYTDADVLALLSKHEAYGMVVAEALALGTPCIVANTSALEEWVDKRNCFGVSYPVNGEELVETINRTIGKRVKDIKLLDWDDIVKSVIKVYESCLM
jgi:glycosyltransferase involved in cell wall biosynthesis